MWLNTRVTKVIAERPLTFNKKINKKVLDNTEESGIVIQPLINSVRRA